MADSSLQTLDTSQGSPEPAELFRTRTGFRSRGSALSSVTEGGNLGNLGRSYNQSHTKAPEFIRWISQRGDFTALHPQREQPCCHSKVLFVFKIHLTTPVWIRPAQVKRVEAQAMVTEHD